MRQTVRSIAEIDEIERAYRQGVPALGHAASELVRRWQYPLRDSETFLRVAFLSWYREHEPEWLTGLEAELPSVESLVGEHGGENSLSAEELFTLACLWNVFAPLGADEQAYRTRCSQLAERAAALEPTSRLFRDWRFFLGEEDDTRSPRIYLEPEVHARYDGRGAMGDYLAHSLLTRLREQGRRQAGLTSG